MMRGVHPSPRGYQRVMLTQLPPSQPPLGSITGGVKGDMCGRPGPEGGYHGPAPDISILSERPPMLRAMMTRMTTAPSSLRVRVVMMTNTPRFVNLRERQHSCDGDR